MPAPNPSSISRDPSLLHLAFLDPLTHLLNQLHEEGYPLSVYEAYRTPIRQAQLYSQGRNGKEGRITTNSRPWSSLHQYGLAADMSYLTNNTWFRDISGVDSTHPIDGLTRLHQLAYQFGLEPGDSDKSHIQLSGYNLRDLQEGKLPGGGGDKWWANMLYQVKVWKNGKGSPSAPPLL